MSSTLDSRHPQLWQTLPGQFTRACCHISIRASRYSHQALTARGHFLTARRLLSPSLLRAFASAPRHPREKCSCRGDSALQCSISTQDSTGERSQTPSPMRSFQFSRSVVSNSLRPHGLHHARAPCPSPTPGASSDSCPSSR